MEITERRPRGSQMVDWALVLFRELLMGSAQIKCSACLDHVLDLVCLFRLFGMAVYLARSTHVHHVQTILLHSACLDCCLAYSSLFGLFGDVISLVRVGAYSYGHEMTTPQRGIYEGAFLMGFNVILLLLKIIIKINYKLTRVFMNIKGANRIILSKIVSRSQPTVDGVSFGFS